MEKLYWINGIAFVGLLNKYGYKWPGGEIVGGGMSGMEQMMEDQYAHVISVDHLKKTLRVVPLEIYAPGSPTANAEKYKKIVDICGSLKDLKNDLASANIEGEKIC